MLIEKRSFLKQVMLICDCLLSQPYLVLFPTKSKMPSWHEKRHPRLLLRKTLGPFNYLDRLINKKALNSGQNEKRFCCPVRWMDHTFSGWGGIFPVSH
jgi:hypothetical protein